MTKSKKHKKVAAAKKMTKKSPKTIAAKRASATKARASRVKVAKSSVRKPTAKAAITEAPPKKPVAAVVPATTEPAGKATVAKSRGRKPTAKTAITEAPSKKPVAAVAPATTVPAGKATVAKSRARKLTAKMAMTEAPPKKPVAAVAPATKPVAAPPKLVMGDLVRFPIAIAGSDCFALKLSVGKPAVLVNVLLDTGSSMLVVNADPYHRETDTGASNSLLLQKGSFGGSDFLAAVVRTQVGMSADGTTAAMTLPTANLGVVYKVKPFLFGNADGILGLAYPPLNQAILMPADTWETSYTPTQLQGLERPADNLAPYVDQLASDGLVADKFAFAVGRSVASVADASLNSGVFVLGGGEECADLYTGGFDSVAVVHEAYYHTNLVAVRVGGRSIGVAPTSVGDPAVSNSFIDSGNGGLMLDPGLYQQVIPLFNEVDPTFGPMLQARGHDQAQLDLAAWPTIEFVLQSTAGTQAALGVEPKDYWQFDYPNAGTATARLIGSGAPKPGQSILGLPLFAGRYVVFDRTGGAGRGVIKFAARRAPEAAPLVA
jgi:hypothetical protein